MKIKEIKYTLRFLIKDLKNENLFIDYCGLMGINNIDSVDMLLKLSRNYNFWVYALKCKAFAIAKVFMYIYVPPCHHESNKKWKEKELWDAIFESNFSIDNIINGKIGFNDVEWENDNIKELLTSNLLELPSPYDCSDLKSSFLHKKVRIGFEKSGIEESGGIAERSQRI
jgi:hypothetical protein